MCYYKFCVHFPILIETATQNEMIEKCHAIGDIFTTFERVAFVEVGFNLDKKYEAVIYPILNETPKDLYLTAALEMVKRRQREIFLLGKK